jgi:hypothetical protein
MHCYTSTLVKLNVVASKYNEIYITLLQSPLVLPASNQFPDVRCGDDCRLKVEESRHQESQKSNVLEEMDFDVTLDVGEEVSCLAWIFRIQASRKCYHIAH